MFNYLTGFFLVLLSSISVIFNDGFLFFHQTQEIFLPYAVKGTKNPSIFFKEFMFVIHSSNIHSTSYMNNHCPFGDISIIIILTWIRKRKKNEWREKPQPHFSFFLHLVQFSALKRKSMNNNNINNNNKTTRLWKYLN